MQIEEIYKAIQQLRQQQLEEQTITQQIELADHITAGVLGILSDIKLCNRYLQELNAKIAERIGHVDMPTSPAAYKEVHSVQFPLPPEEQNVTAKNCWHCFEEILLTQEQHCGVNLDRKPEEIAEFIGNVPEPMADSVVLDNSLWNDFIGDYTAIYHGRYSHRVQHYIITRAIEDGVLDSYAPLTSQLNLREPGCLLKHLVYTRTQYKFFVRSHFVCDINFFSTQVHGRKKTHWQLALENDRDDRSNTFNALYDAKGNLLPHLAGPAEMMQHLLSSESFATKPCLAHAIYHSGYDIFFQLAKIIDCNAEQAFLGVVKCIQEKSPDEYPGITSIIQSITCKKIQHPKFSPVSPDSVAGVLDLHSLKITPYQKAVELFKKGCHGEAEKLFKEAIEGVQPDNKREKAICYHSLGSNLKKQCKWHEAQKAYQKHINSHIA